MALAKELTASLANLNYIPTGNDTIDNVSSLLLYRRANLENRYNNVCEDDALTDEDVNEKLEIISQYTARNESLLRRIGSSSFDTQNIDGALNKTGDNLRPVSFNKMEEEAAAAGAIKKKTQGEERIQAAVDDSNLLLPYTNTNKLRPSSVTLSKALNESRKSGGDSFVAEGKFHSNRKDVDVMLKFAKNMAVLEREFGFMKELCDDHPDKFIRPYAFLCGKEGGIKPFAVGDDVSDLYCIVMEKGVGDLAEYMHLRNPKKNGGLSLTEKLSITESLLDIIYAAHSSAIVLMDFKPGNVVRVSNGIDFILKAIDFDSACRIDDNINNDVSCTPKYVSPEVAKIMLSKLANINSGDIFASTKIDIFALGLFVFELASESTTMSLWESLGIRSNCEKAILEKAANITDEEIKRAIASNFGGDLYRDLRSWLEDALKVNPSDRWDAHRLKHNHSLFRKIAPTYNVGSIDRKLGGLASKDDFRKSMAEITAKLDGISESQMDSGILIRQMISESDAQHAEMKSSLSGVNKAMEVFSSLEPERISGLSGDAMRELIQSSVQKSLEQVGSLENLNLSVKKTIMDTMKQCSEGTNGEGTDEEVKAQLVEVTNLLFELRDDMKNISAEIAEIRKDILEVNAALGAHNNMLRTIIENKHNCPTMVLVFPTKASTSEGKFSRMKSKIKGFFTDEMIVSFVCPVTKKAAKSGPDGKGYRLVIPKAFVKRLAPIIAISFTIVKIAASTYGIPFPCPPLPDGLTSNAYFEKLMEELGDIVGDMTEVFLEEKDISEEVAESFEEVQSALEVCKDSNSLSKMKQKKLSDSVNYGTAISYLAIRELLVLLERAKNVDISWEPKQTGLVRHTSAKDGTTAWVSSEGIERFDEFGIDAFGS